MDTLRQAIARISPISGKDFNLVAQGATYKKYGTKDYLLREGQLCRGVYLIKEGLVAGFRLSDGKEIYQKFFLPDSFATDVTALTGQQPANTNLVALEPTVAIFLPREHLLAMYEVSPDFLTFGKTLLSGLLAEQTEETFRLTSMTARQRYDHLAEHQPELLQRVPLQYLSSFLGMSRETLSRVRRKG